MVVEEESDEDSYEYDEDEIKEQAINTIKQEILEEEEEEDEKDDKELE